MIGLIQEQGQECKSLSCKGTGLKPLALFHREKKAKNGRKSICIACSNAGLPSDTGVSTRPNAMKNEVNSKKRNLDWDLTAKFLKKGLLA